MKKHFQPRKHQRLAIDWLTNRKQAALFAGMGLGKTASVLQAFENLVVDGYLKGLLIVAPLRVATLTWPNELEKWSDFSWIRFADLRTNEGKKAWSEGTADIYLINYEQIPKFCNEFLKGGAKKKIPVNGVVWDELSKAKNHSSKRINAFRKYRSLFQYHWGLTGTPQPNGLLDLFAQVRLLDDGQRLGKFFTRYRDTYFQVSNPFSDFPKFVPLPGSKEKINAKISDLALVLRSEDYLEVPETETIDIDCPLKGEPLKRYKEIQKEFLTEIKDKEIIAANAGVQVMKLLQITSGAIYDDKKKWHLVHDEKLKQLDSIHKKLKEPLLVITSFRHEQERIFQAFKSAKPFTEESYHEWRKGAVKMLVADSRSIGHGVDGLQEGGRTVVWFTPTYSSDNYNQTNARLIRTGQTKKTKVFRLVCPGTIDDAAIDACREKTEEQNSLLLAVRNLQRMN